MKPYGYSIVEKLAGMPSKYSPFEWLGGTQDDIGKALIEQRLREGKPVTIGEIEKQFSVYDMKPMLDVGCPAPGVEVPFYEFQTYQLDAGSGLHVPPQKSTWSGYLSMRTSFLAQSSVLSHYYKNAFFNWREIIGIDPAAEPPKPLPEVMTETNVVGYRAWNVHPIGTNMAFLSSTGVQYYWPHGEPATCANESQGFLAKSFEAGSHVGIHAYTSMRECIRQMQTATVFGEVELGGKIFAHTMGYRAEVGYPRSLTVVWNSNYDIPLRERLAAKKAVERTAQLLRRGYGCEVRIMKRELFMALVRRNADTDSALSRSADRRDTPPTADPTT